jgi:hypothetical protein
MMNVQCLLLFGLHVLGKYAGTVAVPLIPGSADLNVLFSSKAEA